LTGQGSRTTGRLRFQQCVMRTLEAIVPSGIMQAFNWASYRRGDACVALTGWEAHLLTYLYGAPPEKVHVIPNGVEDVSFQSLPATRGQWLVSTATITERKRVLELAEAAVVGR